ncbi:MAG: 4'-phosphopantetheinyl transferase superfamily protein [Melioribacteraceae bacterium]|nr:4'-phosphopantetheinyl transferase superfamily protein [Melioribacteraceae bacterium]
MSFDSQLNILDQLDCFTGLQSVGEINKSDFSLYYSQLNDAERDIYNSLKFEKRKLEWMAGRLAAKKAFSKFCDKMKMSKIENVTILNNNDRAPYFKEYPELQLSITHSNEFALAAVSKEPIGIDLECIDSGSPILLNYFFSEKETQLIQNESETEEEVKASITKYWTRKEAVAKYLKLGMQMNFRSIDTTADYLSVNNNSNDFIKLISYKMNNYYLSVAS